MPQQAASRPPRGRCCWQGPRRMLQRRQRSGRHGWPCAALPVTSARQRCSHRSGSRQRRRGGRQDDRAAAWRVQASAGIGGSVPAARLVPYSSRQATFVARLPPLVSPLCATAPALLAWVPKQAFLCPVMHFLSAWPQLSAVGISWPLRPCPCPCAPHPPDLPALTRPGSHPLPPAGVRRVPSCVWCGSSEFLMLGCAACPRCFCFKCFQRRPGLGINNWSRAGAGRREGRRGCGAGAWPALALPVSCWCFAPSCLLAGL